MKEIIEKARLNLGAGKPFAVYAKPGSGTVTGIFQNDAVAYPLDFSAAGFVFAPFSGEGVFIPAEAAEVVTARFEPHGNASAEALPPKIDMQAKKDFEALVAKSVAAIKDGKFEKLVCSRKEVLELREISIPDVYNKLLGAYPAAFRYCFYHPKTGLWMGATPEQLLEAEGGSIHTVALAGTQLYKEGEEAVWPVKEQQEQKYVTDYIIKELKPYTAHIEATAPYTFRAGNIVHIKTDIKAGLKREASLTEVIAALHPTPAVCGLPKADAKNFLLKHEGYDREYYSGFLGEINSGMATGEKGRTDLFVNLRCMKIEDNTAQLFIGCGITRDSDPQKEFTETVNKSMTMRRALGP